MPDDPLSPIIHVPPDQAEAILRAWLGRDVTCTGLQRLLGGCCATVVEVSFDGPESPVVVKLTEGDDGPSRDAELLTYYRTHTGFPLPEPFFWDTLGGTVPFSYLVMERLRGCHLGDARLDQAEHTRVQQQMAHAVGELHCHSGEAYGILGHPEAYDDWPTCMYLRIEDLYREEVVGRLLSTEAMARIGHVLDDLPAILDAPGPPTLVHGDIWATNIIVDGDRLSGFVDPTGWFAHREYELAYLELWRTVGPAFFEVYADYHPILDGYERRRPIYWLHTLLLHVWLFQTPNYIDQTEALLSTL